MAETDVLIECGFPVERYPAPIFVVRDDDWSIAAQRKTSRNQWDGFSKSEGARCFEKKCGPKVSW